MIADARRGSPLLRHSFLWVSATLLSVVSVQVTGFRFGINNNVYHIPVVLELAHRAEFEGDAFYASLSGFTSVVWPLVRLVANEDNIRDVFRALHYASRALAFLALAYALRAFRLPSGAVFCALAVICATPWLVGTSPLGGHGLFIGYFTHSETTWGILVFSWIALHRGRLGLAMTLTGAVFSINAFIGIWNLVAIASATALGKPAMARLSSLAGGVAGFAVLAMPSALWILRTISTDEPNLPFSYREYIRLHFPDHFLIEAATWSEVVQLGLLCWSGVCGASILPRGRVWIGLLGGFMVLFLVGIPTPYIFDNRFLFNLALLRSDGMLEFLSVTLVVAAAVRVAFAHDVPAYRWVVAQTLLLVLVSPTGRQLPLSAAIAALAAALVLSASRPVPLLRKAGACLSPSAALAVSATAVAAAVLSSANAAYLAGGGSGYLWAGAVAVVPISSVVLLHRTRSPLASTVPVLLVCLISAAVAWRWTNHAVTQSATRDRNWSDLTDWIRNSDYRGVFLVDVRTSYSDSFQLLARRPVWVDWKQGAAGMWQPSFAPRWMTRYLETRSLVESSDYLAYAAEHGISNVVLRGTVENCSGQWRAVHANEEFVFCALERNNQ